MEPPPPKRRRTITAAATQEPRSILDVPDDLLRLILLRLDSPLWLVRAACACRPFRRAVVSGGRAFLRLAASLHPPAVVGNYHNRRDRPVAFVPSSPTDDGRHFSLDFLPRRPRLSHDFLPRRPRAATTSASADWAVADCYGGIVLLHSLCDAMPDLIVCDPLTRRYQGIPHPHPTGERNGCYCTNTFFLDDGDDDGGSISVSNFRVMYQCRVFLHPGTQTFLFNAAADGDGWSFLKQPADDDDYYRGHVAGRVDGSICLGLEAGNIRLLDSTSLQVSKVDLPTRIDMSKVPYGSRFTVVHGAGAGPDPASPPSTWIIHVRGEELEFFRLVRGGGSGGEWVLEHTIADLLEVTRRLPAGGGLEKVLKWTEVDVFAGGTGTDVLSAEADRRFGRRCFFFVNLDTKELQVVPTMETYRWMEHSFTYTLPWPRMLRACPS